MGLVFQDPMTRMNPLMSVGGHLIDTLRAHRPHTSTAAHQERARELLERVGIGANRFRAYPHELSGGMRQRLAIALAIALEPPLLIADEPTTSLDVAVAGQVMAELSGLCQELGSALLLISHDLAMAARWCERMAMLDGGRKVEDPAISCSPGRSRPWGNGWWPPPRPGKADAHRNGPTTTACCGWRKCAAGMPWEAPLGRPSG